MIYLLELTANIRMLYHRDYEGSEQLPNKVNREVCMDKSAKIIMKKQLNVTELAGETLPIGIVEGACPAVKELKLCRGDVVFKLHTPHALDRLPCLSLSITNTVFL